MQIWIGTSGYSYADWVGRFYPSGTRPQHMLPYYAGHFPIVELNFTFYRLPTAAQLAHIADLVPRGFQFVVKLPRTLSHARQHADLPLFRRAVDELRQRGQLLGVLCQLPQAQHNDREGHTWLEGLAAELADYALAVEFRHRSWFRADVAAWLHEQRLDLVAVDVPDLSGLYPSGFVRSGRRVYVRLHSRNAGAWYQSDKERYDYSYSDEELTPWAAALQAEAAHIERALLLFNNCHRAQAAENAQRMQQLLARLTPAAEVVSPFAAPAPRQRLLFD